MIEPYRPQDTMSLWWLGNEVPQGPGPRLIGQLHLLESNRKVALEYDPAWIQNGFALSEDLPLSRGIYLPTDKDTAAGAVDDARPDRWGERVIRNVYKLSRLSVLEFLYFAGDDRFGALGVSLNANAYQPCRPSAVARHDNLDEMHRAIRAILAGEKLDDALVRLVLPGPSFGGARPKSIVEIEGAQWVVKFPEGEDLDTELVEHATMQLAAQCGIQVAETQAIPLTGNGHALAVRRFDRANGQRKHVVSAGTVLRAAGLELGYPELAQTLRRLAPAGAIRVQQLELFRRMIFNILIDNTDDHEKNHALIRRDDGFYELAPAYDVLPSAQGLGQQQLRVGKYQTQSSLANALSECQAFGLKKDAAVSEVRQMVVVVNHWKASMHQAGVSDHDLQILSQYIDGDLLRNQRVGFS